MSVEASTQRKRDLAAAMDHYQQLTGVGTPRPELLALQQRRLVQTAREAATHSPLYRELYAGLELSDDLDVRTLPVVSKAMLMERFDEWVTDPCLHLSGVQEHLEQLCGDELYLGEYRCMPSGGTTGRKGIFVYDRDEWRQCLAAFLRWSELTGMRRDPGRRVRVGRVGASSPLHMTARFGLSLDFGQYAWCHLDAGAPLDDIVAALNAHKPERLMGYPSMVSLLALEQLEGRLCIAPGAVSTNSELRTEEMTANIRAAWGVEPFNLYGTTETLFAGDCEHHQGLHVFEDLALVEVVDDDNRPVPDGVVGTKLLVTSFIKRSQPLLRYELSDMAALDSAQCPCGRPLARMVSVEGRSDDILHLESGDGRTVAVHPLTLRSPMAALPELRQYKIVHDRTGLHVLVALRDGVAADEAARRIDATLRAKLQSASVADPRLEVRIVPELPRQPGHSAKFKLIESRTAPTPVTPAPIN